MFLLIFTVLFAVAAVGQPMVNAPLYNQVGYLSGTNVQATLPAVAAGMFALTTIFNYTSQSNAVVALNLTESAPSGAPAYVKEIQAKPTSIFVATPQRIGVICEDSVLFFGVSETSVWYVGAVTFPGLIFDLYAFFSVFDVPAVGSDGTVFVGSHNSFQENSSVILRIDPTTATVINSVTVPYYQSNFRLQFDSMNDNVVYSLVQESSTSSFYFILPITLSNMALGTPINTTSLNVMRFNVYGGIAAIVEELGNWCFVSLSTGVVLKNGHFNCGGVSNIDAFVSFGRWFVACGSSIAVFDSASLSVLATLTVDDTSNSPVVLAVENWSPTGTVVVATETDVYVINGTVPSLFPINMGVFSSIPLAASFIVNTTIVQISYYNDAVISIDTWSGGIVAYIPNVYPLGCATWLPAVGLNIVSSSFGESVYLAAYNNHFDASQPAFLISLSSATPGVHSFVANGTVGYFFAREQAFLVNLTSGSTIGLPISINATSFWTYGPVLVGEYACMNSLDVTFCITLSSALAISATTCTPNARTPYFVFGEVLLVRCANGGLVSWVVVTNSTPLALSGYSGCTPAIVGSIALVQVASATLAGFVVPFATALPTPIFTVSNITLTSNISTVNNNFVFLGYSITSPATVMLYRLNVFGELITTIAMPGLLSAFTIVSHTGGRFGANGWIWLFSSDNLMIAINLNTMKVVYDVPVAITQNVQGTPFVTPQGGICFYSGNEADRFVMINALTGEEAWWAQSNAAEFSQAPFEANGVIFFSVNLNLIVADVVTGKQRTALGFGQSVVSGYAILTHTGTSLLTITAALEKGLIATTVNIEATHHSFPGGNDVLTLTFPRTMSSSARPSPSHTFHLTSTKQPSLSVAPAITATLSHTVVRDNTLPSTDRNSSTAIVIPIICIAVPLFVAAIVYHFYRRRRRALPDNVRSAATDLDEPLRESEEKPYPDVRDEVKVEVKKFFATINDTDK